MYALFFVYFLSDFSVFSFIISLQIAGPIDLIVFYRDLFHINILPRKTFKPSTLILFYNSLSLSLSF